MDDENIFLIAGFVDDPMDYKGAIGVYDYFWALTPDIRKKLIIAWKKTINYLEEEQDNLQELFDAEEDWGCMALFHDEEAVEIKKPKDNVVQFPK